MKILTLRFENLNSLTGEWLIDFTKDDYSKEGIFTIAGPTGAGKSTILDAICLALYGKTPRLDAVNKKSNEIMSRQKFRCFAEVTFATNTGQFCCHWSQHRAEKSGHLQESKHELSDATGAIIETKKKEVLNAIVQKTGMDFAQFTRSMMLAQGGFAAFLQANANDRSPILEQITGTEIYSDISKLVHQINREQQEQLSLLQAKMNSSLPFTETEYKQLQQQLQQDKQDESNLKQQIEQLNKQCLWLQNKTKLQDELIQINNKLTHLKEQQPQIQLLRVKQQRGQQAIMLEPDYTLLKIKRKQQKQDINLLAEHHARCPHKKDQQRQIELEFIQTTAQLESLKETIHSEYQKIKQVRLFDEQLIQLQLNLKKEQSNVQKITDNITQQQQQWTQLQQQQDQYKQQLANIELYLSRYAINERLISELTGIKEQLRRLDELKRQLDTVDEKEQHLQQELSEFNARYQQQNKLVQSLQNSKQKNHHQLEQQQQQLADVLAERSLREYKTQWENLLQQRSYLNRIASLEQERQQLLDGVPCPLCGAIDHPYALGNVPETDDIDFQIKQLMEKIKQAELIEQTQQEIQQAQQQLEQQLSKEESISKETLYKYDHIKESMQHVYSEKVQISTEYQQVQHTLQKQLDPYFLENEFDLHKQLSDIIIEQLELKMQKFLKQQQLKQSIIENKTPLTSKQQYIMGNIEISKQTQQQRQTQIETLMEQHQQLKEKRHQYYGNKNPDEQEQLLQRQRTISEQALESKRTQKEQVTQELAQLMVEMDRLTQNIEAISLELNVLEPNFMSAYQQVNFNSEDDLKQAKLTTIEYQSLQQQLEQFDEQQGLYQTQKNDREQQLAQEATQNLTEFSLSYLQEQGQQLEPQLKQLTEAIGAIKQKLKDNDDVKIRQQQQLKQIDAQKKECLKWQTLHDLIGSADGKKYRNFAQGITFETMICHANEQLKTINDRYLLIRDQTQPLELNVIDDYQAGEIRSTKNLSGGESFLISLSLALGLSQMASKKVRVDSLFLDEGFGTLDEDALELALDSLSKLHQYGKLIGIISHIPALKDRIKTQINVLPISGGHSEISGPGCQRIS